MMIALALTGIVAYVALDMFAGQQANYTRTREKVRLQDDAREAMRVVEEDIRNAGFRTSVSLEPTGLAGSVTRCDAYVLDDNSAAFTAGNNATISGDTIRVRYIEPNSATGQVVCAPGSSFREIGYMQVGDTLKRRVRNDTTTNAPWVDMIYNVVTFQVEYGLLSDPSDNGILSNTQLTTAANWTGSGSMTATTTGSAVTLTNWKTTAPIVGCYKNPIAVDPRYTYRVAFDLSMSANMRTGADAIDSNVVSQLPIFAVGFFSSNIGTPTDTVYAYPQDPATSVRHIELYLSPATAGNRYLGFQTIYKAGANVNSTQSITITNASLSVVSRGQYFSWVDAPAAGQRRFVKAVRVNLLVKASKSDDEATKPVFTNLDASGLGYTATGSDTTKTHILYQRIIPVVNNGI